MTKDQINHRFLLHSHSPCIWNIEKSTDKKLVFPLQEDYQGHKIIRINSHNRNWELFQNQSVDISITGINGLIDGIPLTNNSFYFLWLILKDPPSEIIGFGLTKQPKATLSSISNGNKGYECTIVVSPDSLTSCAYQFTKGAKVSIYLSNANYNLGTITDISDKKTINVQLDNNSNYGTNLSGIGHTIVQHNLFLPWNVGKSYTIDYQILTYNFYQLMTGCIYINGGSNIQQFYREPNGRVFWNDFNSVKQKIAANSSEINNICNLVPPTATVVNFWNYMTLTAAGMGYFKYLDYINNKAIGYNVGYTTGSSVSLFYFTELLNQYCLAKVENNNANDANFLCVHSFYEEII